IDAVLDLVGNTVVLDSLAMLRRGGRSCLVGWLGGPDPIPDFNPLLQMPSGVYLTFFASFVFGTPGFPLSDVPPVGSTSSRPGSSASTRSVRLSVSWRPTKPMANWLSFTTDLTGMLARFRSILQIAWPVESGNEL